jgi:hypothetical protein
MSQGKSDIRVICPDAALNKTLKCSDALNAAICPVGHANGRMAFRANAIVLVLTAEDALAVRVAVTVSTAPAQRGRRRSQRRNGGGKNNNSEQRN